MTKGEGKAVLVVLTNVTILNREKPYRTGFDVKEMAFIYRMLHREYGIEINLASPAGGPCQIDPMSLKASEHEEDVQQFLADECAMQWLQCTDKLGAFDMQRFQCVLFVGGPGAMMDFPMATEAIQETIRYIYEGKEGVVGAIGHGVAALIKVRTADGKRLIEGKRVTANTKEEDEEMELNEEFPFKLEDELQKSGADFKKAGAFSRNVVIDNRIITGQNRNSTRDWIKQVASHLQH